MPYRHAYLFNIALLACAAYVFWPSSLAELAEFSWAYHLHFLTATLWMLALVAQNLAIHRGHRALHRRVGQIMFLLVPLFTLAGAIMVQNLAASERNFAQLLGDRLVFVDSVSMLAFAGLCYASLAQRRNTWLHGGYLLVTPLMFIMPLVTRFDPLIGLVRGLDPDGGRLETFSRLFDIGTALALAAAAVLYACNRRHAAPFVAIAAVTLLQWIGFHTVDTIPAWASITSAIAGAFPPAVALTGFLIGLAAVVFGWRAVTRPMPATA